MSMPSEPSDGARYAGVLSNGRNATTMPVKVRLADAGLEIILPRGPPVAVWPYGELRSNVPLHAGAPDVLLSRAPNGVATLFVADPAFARQLLVRARELSAVHQRWLGLRPGLAALALVAVAVAALWLLDLHPSQAVARLMPQQARETLGRNVVASLASDRKACETPAGRAALDRLTARLTAAASDKPMTVRVVLLDWDLVNAFAVPGGQLILTRGLVQKAGSPDEVAGVLAHELGHAIELHPETGLVRAMGLAAAAQLVFAGSSGTVSNLGLILTQLRYTRVAEREADAHALRILKNSGVSPKGFGDFFERIEGRPLPEGAVKRIAEFELIRTHPLTTERLALIRAQPAYPATPALGNADWQALQDMCPAPARPPGPQPADIVAADREIAEATKTLEANPNDVAALQKRARAHARKRQHDLALADFAKAAGLKPGDAALHLGRAQAHQNLRQYEQAITAYDEAIRLAPNNVAARNGRGNTNRALKRHDDALRDFDELIKLNPKNVAGLYNRALTYADMSRPDDAMRDFTAAIGVDKDFAGAYTQRALLHEKTGARDQAIADFRAALAAPAKYDSGPWAHRTARERLAALGAANP